MLGYFIPINRACKMQPDSGCGTIQEFTQLGSGYQLAMRDMEIRGVGNLLGVRTIGSNGCDWV
uniref:Uncharacterized protein n=1 Tax=Desertifilum tharense IPPAS B-1220 TaxID=1781255 RepID=A0ACD5GSW2_9CYAN